MHEYAEIGKKWWWATIEVLVSLLGMGIIQIIKII